MNFYEKYFLARRGYTNIASPNKINAVVKGLGDISNMMRSEIYKKIKIKILGYFGALL